MNDVDDRALTIALDDGPTPKDDAVLALAVERARRDIDRIRRGLVLVAAHEEQPAKQRSRVRRRVLVAAAAAAVVAGVAGVALAVREDPTPLASPTSTVGAPSIASGQSAPALTLDERVAQADRIVVGTITAIDRGEVAGLPYVLATIDVSETIKPSAGGFESPVVAFDYDLSGAITSADSTAAPWAIGDEVLLFLVSDAGTVSEDLQPSHLQIAEGAGGRYPIVNDEVVGPFTLDEVRQRADA